MRETMKYNFCYLLLIGLTLSQTIGANEKMEEVTVLGTRQALYTTRDVNAAALGIKETLSLPISVQSFSEELIKNQRVQTLSELLANDASVQNTGFGDVFDLVSLRGFQLDWNNGLRRDGLSLAPYQDVPLENIQRVDVLKGSSGLLSGFNNFGGTVNYVTKRPTQENFLELTAEARSRDGKYLHIDTGGRFSEHIELGYRVNLAREDNGDFSGGDDVERDFFSAAIDWKPSQKWLLRFDADYQDRAVVSQPLIGLSSNPISGAPELPPYVDMSRVLLGQPWALYETKTLNVGARADYSINDTWRWIAQVAYSGNDRFTIFPDIYAVNRQGDVLSSAIWVTPDESYDSLSAHSFVSGEMAIGQLRHELVIGASYRTLEAIDGRWFDLPNPVGNIFSPVHATQPAFPALSDANRTDTTEEAVFISDVVHFNEHIYATLGVRHLQYFQKQRAAGATVRETLHDERFTTPSAGLTVAPSDHLSIYVNYSEGAGEGAVAVIGSGALNEGERLSPQESEQVEFGLKYQTSAAIYSIAVYEISKTLEYHNRVSNYFVADGEQRHRGLELNASGEVTEELSLIASASFIDAEIRGLSGETELIGNRPANVPEVQANVFLDYVLPFAERLSVNAGAYYVGEREQSVQNTLQLPSYVRLDAGLRYQFVYPAATLRLKVENLSDREYWVSAGATGIDWGVQPGRGRTVMASVTFEF